MPSPEELVARIPEYMKAFYEQRRLMHLMLLRQEEERTSIPEQPEEPEETN